MSGSLRIDDGDDLLDLRRDLETAFAMRFTDGEAAGCETVGDLFQVIQSRFPPDAGGKCMTAMAFYRLRRALSGIGSSTVWTTGMRLDALPGPSARSLYAELEERSGLKLPSWRLTMLGLAGAWAVAGGCVSLLVFVSSNGWHGALLPFLACAGGAVLLRTDPGRLPLEGQTLGALARQVACLNFGTLHAQGARPRERDIWGTLCAALSHYTVVPMGMVHRGTTIMTGPPHFAKS